jgi:hypothetical protein
MRRALSFLLPAATLVAAASMGSALAQTASTDPVGFITVSAGGGSVAAPKFSLISPTLLRPVEWQGAATVNGTTVTVTGTPWTAAQFGTNGQYFVEIATGATPGAWTDIQSNGTNSLTTFDNLTAFAGANTTIRIRKHTKLVDFFGTTNSAGFLGGTSLADSDEVTIYDGTSAATYFYYNASGNNGVGAGWVDTGFNSASNVTIAPNQGIVIKRKAASTLNFTSIGSVKTGNTLLPVSPGLNVIGTVAAAGLTLATSGLYTGNVATGVKGGNSLTNADEVMLITANGTSVYFYYDGSDNGGAGAGWVDARFNAAGTTPIFPGTSLVVTRKAPNVAFNWTQPSPTTF